MGKVIEFETPSDRAMDEQLQRIKNFLEPIIEADKLRKYEPNPVRIQQYEAAYAILSSLAEETGATVYKEKFDVFQSMWDLQMNGLKLEFTNVRRFIMVARMADNMSIVPKTDGSIDVGFAFHDVKVPAE